MDLNSGNELVILASTLSILISEIADQNKLDLLGNLFSAIGENLSLIASQSSKSK